MTDSIYAIGLMSGTSMDGVDAAIIKTDGINIDEIGEFLFYPYDKKLVNRLKNLHLDQIAEILSVERELTQLHAKAVKELRKTSAKKIDIIGFHGQTIFHDAKNKLTWQIGNGSLLAAIAGIDVVADFRRHDIALGGGGAPLTPIYHRAIASNIKKPVAIVNIGGVSNITWIGEDDEILAFDSGPGNALLDDWVYKHTGKYYDKDGLVAFTGITDFALVQNFFLNDFFTRKPPKSLDRNEFIDFTRIIDDLSLEDGASLLTEITVRAIIAAKDFMPLAPKEWVITGGGRKNQEIMRRLKNYLGVPVKVIEEYGINGDALEAEAFAFLAVRSLYGLPITMPETTGVKKPATGGALYRA